MTERNANHIIPSCCHLPASCRCLLDRCGSLGSCKPQIYLDFLKLLTDDSNIYNVSSNWYQTPVQSLYGKQLCLHGTREVHHLICSQNGFKIIKNFSVVKSVHLTLVIDCIKASRSVWNKLDDTKTARRNTNQPTRDV